MLIVHVYLLLFFMLVSISSMFAIVDNDDLVMCLKGAIIGYCHCNCSACSLSMQTFCDIKDLSYGKENVPISCVNGIDRQYPDYVEYSNQRIPAKGVQLVLDPEFLVGCDCTDGCRVRLDCRERGQAASTTYTNSSNNDADNNINYDNDVSGGGLGEFLEPFCSF